MGIRMDGFERGGSVKAYRSSRGLLICKRDVSQERRRRKAEKRVSAQGTRQKLGEKEEPRKDSEYNAPWNKGREGIAKDVIIVERGGPLPVRRQLLGA